jgi:hypothetical protein
MTTQNEKIAAIAANCDLSNPHSVIGARILTYAVNFAAAHGCDIGSEACVKFAMNKVLGAGSYEKLVSEFVHGIAA